MSNTDSHLSLSNKLLKLLFRHSEADIPSTDRLLSVWASFRLSILFHHTLHTFPPRASRV